MNILIAYATYSGSTQMACDFLTQELIKMGHQPTLKLINQLSFDEMNNFDLIIFASPSWDFEGKEGQPHQDFLTWMENNNDKKFEGKKFAVIGLGDSSFSHFCGGADIIENFIKNKGGILKTESLKIDKYLLDPPKNNQLISQWIKKII
jgi:sulfite reductase (NADPH) flavoprotein alpha-component